MVTMTLLVANTASAQTNPPPATTPKPAIAWGVAAPQAQTSVPNVPKVPSAATGSWPSPVPTRPLAAPQTSAPAQSAVRPPIRDALAPTAAAPALTPKAGDTLPGLQSLLEPDRSASEAELRSHWARAGLDARDAAALGVAPGALAQWMQLQPPGGAAQSLLGRQWCDENAPGAPRLARVEGEKVDPAILAWSVGAVVMSPDATPPRMVLTGGLAGLLGACFGDTPGQIELWIGPARAKNALRTRLPEGRSVAVTVQSWSASRIFVKLPADLAGLPPGEASFIVRAADGRASEARTAPFFPAWNQVDLPASADISLLSCAEPAGTAARCVVRQQVAHQGSRLQGRVEPAITPSLEQTALFAATHYQDTDNAPPGTDRYRLRMPPWAFPTGSGSSMQQRGYGQAGPPIRLISAERVPSAPANYEIEVPWPAPGKGQWAMAYGQVRAIVPRGIYLQPMAVRRPGRVVKLDR